MRKLVVGLLCCCCVSLLAQTATINGQIEGKQLFSIVKVSKLSANGGLDFVTSQPVSTAGTFSIDLQVPSADVYVLQFTDGNQLQRQQVMVLLPNDKLTLRFNNTYQSMQLQDAVGSEDARFILQYQQNAVKAEDQAKGFEQRYMQATTPDAKKAVQTEFESFYKLYQQNNMRFYAAHAHLLSAGFMAMSEFGGNFDANVSLFKVLYNGLKEKYAQHPLVKEMDIRLQSVIAVGAVAPDFEIAGVDGTTLRLSDFKGKYVLLDFWASWCGPCRMENPTLVKVYQQYKDKNFAIFSISLDNNREKWLSAIQADGLIWKSHASSLMRWNCPVARRYNVSSIPHSLLIDPKGKVVAIGLRGEALMQTLSQLLGK